MSEMNCNVIARILEDTSLDPAAPLPPEARKHLDRCPRCRVTRENTAQFEDALTAAHAANDEPGLPGGFHARFVEELRKKPAHTRRYLRTRIWATAPASIAAGAAMFFASGNRQDEAQQFTGDSAPVSAVDATIFTMDAPSLAAIKMLPTPDRVYGDAGRQLGSLGISFYRATESAARALLPEKQS